MRKATARGIGIGLLLGLMACGQTPPPDIARLEAALEADLGGPITVSDIRRDHAQRYTLIYSHGGREGRASFRYVDRGWRLTRMTDSRMRLRFF